MSSNVTADLIRALIEHLRGASDDWESLSMVIDYSGGRFGGTHGYTYSPNGGISAVASHPFHIESAVTAFMESYYKPGEELPVAVLVQFDRVKGDYEVTFEDSDVSRWKVTPANLDEIREKLRPSFE